MDAAPELVASLNAPPVVLLADADADTREMYSLALHLENLQVLDCCDGIAALHLAREAHPDVVVTEIALPQIDGFDLARNLKRDAATAGIHIIGVTGYSRGDLWERSSDAGFETVLLKPVAPDALIEAVHRVLEASSAARERTRTIRAQSAQLRQKTEANRKDVESLIEQARTLLDKLRDSWRRDG